MIKIYGSMMCPDCVRCREELDKSGIAYEYLDFSESLLNLKEFLAMRDSLPAFDQIKASGKIGIPCIVRENGTVALSWEEYLK